MQIRVLSGIGSATAASTANVERMNYRDFYQRQFDLSIIAGTNQRFHQKLARRWTNRNRIVQVSVAVLAVAALTLALSDAGRNWEIGAAVLAAIAAIVLNVFPLGDWAQEHRELFRRWCDLREEIDSLAIEVEDEPIAPEYLKRIMKSQSEVHRIGASQVGLGWLDERLLMKCEIAEKTSKPNVARECIPQIVPLPLALWDGFWGLWDRPKAD